MQYTGIIYFTMSTMEIARLILRVTFTGNCKGAPVIFIMVIIVNINNYIDQYVYHGSDTFPPDQSIV